MSLAVCQLRTQQILRRQFLLALCLFQVMASIALAQEVVGRQDQYGGVQSMHVDPTGWFGLRKFGDRWMFVTPEGNAFFSIGITHANDCIRRDELNLFETKFGKDEMRLSSFLIERIKGWGYNSAGYGVLQPMQQRIPYVATIPTLGPQSLSAGEKSHCFDLFDSAVQTRLKLNVQRSVASHVDNEHCLGYVFIDLPIWGPTDYRNNQIPTYADFYRQLGPERPGKKAYLDFLHRRYKDNRDELKRKYGIADIQEDEIDKIQFSSVDVTSNREVRVDDEAFMNEVADLYYAMITKDIRQLDPHHLIFGDRFMALPDRTPDSILKTSAKYVDAITFQPMGTRVPLEDYMNRIGELTGIPVFLADVNTMTRRPEKDETQMEEYERSAGEHTLAYYLNAASSPFCVGIHRCTIRDYQPWNIKFHRRGLLKVDDTPHSILIEYTQRTNRLVYDMVYQN